jgi:hypothetical protein
MRLIVLPCDPDSPGGYNRVAADDLRRLGAAPGDVVCVYLQRGRKASPGHLVVQRPGRGSIRQFVNLASMRPFSDVWTSQLRPLLRGQAFDEIFCGDVIFYNALRSMFPHRPLTVRFHNLFGLAQARYAWRHGDIDLHFRLTLDLTARLERRICSDPLVHPVFINPREQEFYRLMWPTRPSDVWGVKVDAAAAVSGISQPRLLYLGGTASHQVVGISYLIERVLPALSDLRRDVELHLWGDGTERFSKPLARVFGHGFWQGDGLPDGGNGLFVIPDLLGGGVKVKTGDALRDGVPFITTPFGAEGYEVPNATGRIVAEMDEWASEIAAFFRTQGV